MWRRFGWGCGGLLAVPLIVGLVFATSRKGRALRDAVMRVIETDELNGGSLKTADEVVRYLEAHPDRYALAAWDVGSEDAGLFHDADRSWPLASTVKVIPLALASEEIAAGRWSVELPTPEVESFYLPGTDGDAHLRGNADGGTAKLGGAIHSMIRFSDNAATDAILFRLGRDRLTSTEPGLPTPHPLSGSMLLASRGWADDGGVEDAAWQAARHLSEGPAPEPSISIAVQEKMVREFDNRGTTRAFARLMERLFTDDTQRFATAREALSWPMEFESNRRDFEVIATKGGSLVTVLTSVSFAKTKTGQRRVVALFLHDLPFATWATLSQSFAHQQLERELLGTPDALERLRPRLGVELAP